MAGNQFAPVLGKRVRLTTLDACGNTPEAGTEDAFGVTDGFVSVSLTPETEDPNEINKTRADGTVVNAVKTPPTFKNYGVAIEFTDVYPSILTLISNIQEYVGPNGEVIGFSQSSGPIKTRFALELWSGLSDEACPDDANAEEMSGYFLLPKLNGGHLDNIEINGSDAASFTITGAYTEDGNAWGVGPFDVLQDETGAPAQLPTPLTSKNHLLLIETSLAPPEGSPDLQPMPAGEPEV